MSASHPATPSIPYFQPPALQASQATNAELIRRMLGIGWVFRRRACLAVMLQAMLLALSLSGLGLVGLGIDYIHHTVDPASKPPRWPLRLTPPTDWSPLQIVFCIAGGIIILALIRAILSNRATVNQQRLVQDIVVTLRSQVYDKLQRLSFRFFDANETGSIINRVTGDVQAVRLFVDGVIIQVMILIMSLSFYIFYMLQIHVMLTLLCLASTPLLMGVTIRFSRTVKPAYRKSRQLYDTLILALSENIQGIHVVKGFAREREEIRKFEVANDIVRDQQQWIFERVTTFVPLIGFITQINLIILLGYGGYQYTQGALSIGQGLVVFAVLLQQFSNQVATTANIANSVQRSLIGAQRVFEVLDAPVEIQSPPEDEALRILPWASGSSGRSAPCGRRGSVEFERVTFGYNPGDPVLREVSFHAEAGQCVAIVGATGAGKSTLMSLIPRFYDPQQGVVRVDGHDVRRYDLDDLRRSIGIVFQESFLFSNSVAANIAFGHPEASREQIEKAARIAAAHDFIMELPKGYDTHIGERGSDLSGGQRQRLAIARALLLEPPILLLDDPTAAIDPQTEDEILEAMESAMASRTTFVVAHRLSTLRRADLVIVLEEGRIVQTGTHEQLMAERGHYRRAARLQIADAESMALLGIGPEVGES